MFFILAGNSPNCYRINGDRKEYIKLSSYVRHRAIGVVYNSEQHQYGNYVPTIVPKRYDAFMFIDETRALHPLHNQDAGHQIPETYPFGM